MTKNIMIVGVGGQGTLLASKMLGYVLLKQGYDVKVSEVHGMSQRGGSVVTYVRYGEKVYSPVIDKGEADVIISFEQLEAARWVEFLKKDGVIITNTQKMEPMPVITGAAEYPEGLIEKLTAAGDKVDVVGSLRLQVQKDLGQMPDGDLLTEPLGADGVVLAEAALEGAAGKEHRAAAPCAADARLFPEMEGGAGGFQRTACPAEADPPGGAVRAALPGAKRAGFGCEVGGFGHTI